MAASFLIMGILIGLLFGIPVGAVGTLTIQRVYRHGFAAGLKTGLAWELPVYESDIWNHSNSVWNSYFCRSVIFLSL